MNIFHALLDADSLSAVTAKVGTVVGVSSAPVIGVVLPVIVQVLTVTFLVLQIGYLVWKWRRDFKSKKAE